MVRQLAQGGATVLVSARDASYARSAANDLALPAMSARSRSTWTSPTTPACRPPRLEADPGRLDVLVNNAATYVDWTETATGADLAVAHQVLEVNLFGAWRLAIALLPLLRQVPIRGS